MLSGPAHPEDYRRGLEDHYELVTYAERLRWAKRKLEAGKHCAMALAATGTADRPVAMDLAPLLGTGAASATAGPGEFEAVGAETLDQAVAAWQRELARRRKGLGPKGGGKGGQSLGKPSPLGERRGLPR